MKLDVLNNATSPWYANGLKFTCTQCGNCCTGGPGYVWISEEEIGRLAKRLNLSVEETARKYCRRIGGRISLKETRNARGEYDCVFLHEEKAANGELKRTCTIYSVRPLQCRTWPFWEGNLASEDNWTRAAHRCPGINRGRQYTREEMETLRDAEDWPA